MSSSVASEEASDQQSDRYGSYCPSADVSDSETSFSTASSRRFHFGASSAANSFFPAALPLTPPFMSPDIAPKNVLYWEDIMPLKQNRHSDLSEIEMMKERFAKLLLGEDMSGGSRGVSTALAISNAITNLSATVFGELWRLEPLAPQKKAMWCREMDYLLCVSDSIVELVPSVQNFPGGGGAYEVMTTRPRSDLYMNLPALKKLDEMLLGVLDGFCETEFWYVDRRVVLGEGDNLDVYSAGLPGGRPPSIRQEEKWWLPCPKVPPKGLSEEGRKKIQQCRDCTNQILKAALAINSNVLAEIEIPKAYFDTLPKSGKACLGENIYRYITAEQFSPERLLDCLGLSSEHQMLEIANRIEAAVYVWKLKAKKKRSNHQNSKHKSWGGKVKGLVGDCEKNHFLAHRAETLLRTLRIRFPCLPQTSLDMNKILHNKDVGQSILESYSRVMESLAFNIMARIDDVLFVDDATKQCAAAESMSFFNRGGLDGLPVQKRMSPSPFSVRHTPYASPLATPTFCPSPPLSGSSRKGVQIHDPEKLMPIDLDKLWASYAGSLSSRRTMGDALERD